VCERERERGRVKLIENLHDPNDEQLTTKLNDMQKENDGIVVIREHIRTYHMTTDSSSVPKLFTRTFCSDRSKWQMCSAWSTEIPERDINRKRNDKIKI
jgi:hypothetical protein